MKIDVMSKTELIVLTLISIGLLVAFLVIGGTGPQASVKAFYSAFNCTPPQVTYDPSKCNGVQLGLGQPWTQTWTSLNVMDEYWALAAFPFRNGTAWNKQQAQRAAKGVKLLLTLEGQLPNSHSWQLIANQTEKFQLICPIGSIECDGWWLFALGYLKYEQIRATVRFLNADGLVFDVRFREQIGNQDYNDLRLGFHLSWLGIGVILLSVFLFVMRNKRWDEFTFEQKGATILLLALTGYNDPFFPFKFLVDSIAFPILGAILEELFQLIVVIYWILFLDRYRREPGAPFDPWGRWEIPKYLLVVSYFAFSTSLYAWVRSREYTHPIPGADIPTGMIVLFYFTALSFTGIVLYVLILIFTISHPPGQHPTRSFQRFMYIMTPSVIVMISVTLGVFTNSFGPYGRTLIEYMFFFGMWNLYIWLLVYGAWPHKGSFTEANAIETADQPPISFNNRDPEVDPLLDAPPETAEKVPLVPRRTATYQTSPQAVSTSEGPFGAAPRSDLGPDEGL